MMSRLEDLCLKIQATHRERIFLMETRKRATIALGAYLRTSLGWHRELPAAERKAIEGRAQAMLDYGEAAGKLAAVPMDYPAFAHVIAAGLASAKPFVELEKTTAKRMEALAHQLPVWSWAATVRGLGAVSLATIVGDATSDQAPTIGDYRSKGGLWKRMGIATVDGIAQGKLGKGSAAAAWVEHGYNQRRRARMWVIGDCLIKTNRDGPYRSLYLARKEIERQRDSEAKPIVHHRRAQRIMEQRLLHDLWLVWRRLERQAVAA